MKIEKTKLTVAEIRKLTKGLVMRNEFMFKSSLTNKKKRYVVSDIVREEDSK